MRAAIGLLAGTCAVAGIAYTILAVGAVRRFRQSLSAPTKAVHFPATVLKPLCGTEPLLYENLSSFCTQRYEAYQLIFGAADPRDPALDVARRIQRDHPQCDITIVDGSARPARNPKVANLLGMIDYAKYDVLVIADSDVSVGADYLSTVLSCFADPRVGAATCLYGARAHGGFAAELAALFVNDAFAPSVLVARLLEPLCYCLGATMAVRKNVLQRIGGFAALADHLGDDYVLGQRVCNAGYAVALAPYLVYTDAHERNLPELWLHELRWARTIRAQRPWGFIGSVITNPLPVALACAVLLPAPAGLLLAMMAGAVRLLLHAEAQKTFAPADGAALWLLPVRDFLTMGVWCAGLSGRKVTWRASRYRMDSAGHLTESPLKCNDSV